MSAETNCICGHPARVHSLIDGCTAINCGCTKNFQLAEALGKNAELRADLKDARELLDLCTNKEDIEKLRSELDADVSKLHDMQVYVEDCEEALSIKNISLAAKTAEVDEMREALLKCYQVATHTGDWAAIPTIVTAILEKYPREPR